MKTLLAVAAGAAGIFFGWPWLRRVLPFWTPGKSDDVLAKYVAIARSYDGVGAQKDGPKFAQLVAPNGPEGAANFFLKPNVPNNANSSCGVVAIAFLRLLFRALGLTVPEVEGPLGLDWWPKAVALAKKHGAYHQPSGGGAPGAGSIVHVENSAGGRHWYTMISDSESMDGGLQDAQGYQLIGHRPRRFGPNLLDLTSQKPVIEWIDSLALVRSLQAQGANS